MVRDFLALAGSSILHRKVRSWLTVIGVFIGITAVVALISVGLGLERTINDEVAKVFGVDTFILAPPAGRSGWSGTAPPQTSTRSIWSGCARSTG
jgi:hypothetical protein